MWEDYQILGVDETATDEEITARYKQLKEKYSEERWLDGEAGNQAARMLTKVEVAYKEIMAARKEQSTQTQGANVYEEISKCLKDGDIEKAQRYLDDCNERPAEWHYLQAVVFYKKNWVNDSKKQLEIAMQMDPNNVKYKNAYGKMNAKNDYEQQKAGDTQNPYSRPREDYDRRDAQMGGEGACSQCMSCCYSYMCASCLMDCCCGCR